MAFNKAPTAMWPGYSSDGTNITIPLTSLVGLTAAEANATTGDMREVLLAFIRRAKSYLQALPEADKPDAMSVKVSSQNYVSSGPLADSILISYDVRFYVEEGVADVVDEPA